MLVTFKTIKQEAFKIDVENEETIGDVKKKLEGEKSYAPEHTKLIYSGKVLDDETKFSEINYDEKKFFVVMEQKPKTATTAVTSTEMPTTQAATASTTVQPTTTTTTSANPHPTANPASMSSQSAAESMLVTGPELEHMISEIIGMGFDRKEVLAALQSAHYNPDRAVEYLCTGNIPQSHAGATAAAPPPAGEVVEAEESDAVQLIRRLDDDPQFQQLRQMLRSHPNPQQYLQTMMTALAAERPELVQAIQEHQEEFMAVLNGDSNNDEMAEGDDDLLDEVAANAAQGGNVVQLTPQDMEAVNSLKSMGFAEGLCIEAYLACDKNQDLAVNYILARMDEFNNELDANAGGGQ